MYEVAAIISPLVSAGIALIGAFFFFGKFMGYTNQKESMNQKEIKELKNEVHCKNGRPNYITRDEFNQEIKPEFQRMIDEVKEMVRHQEKNQLKWVKYFEQMMK